jgi:flagellar biosynthesis protein FlhB
MSGEKSFEPTEERLKEAKARGELPKGKFATSLIGVGVFFLSIALGGEIFFLPYLKHGILFQIGEFLYRHFYLLPVVTTLITLIILLPTTLLSHLSEALQGGCRLNLSAFRLTSAFVEVKKRDESFLSQGGKKVWSSLKETPLRFVLLLPLIVAWLGILLYMLLRMLPIFPLKLASSKDGLFSTLYLQKVLFTSLVHVSLLSILLGVGEAALARYRYRRRLMMSHQELKDESKEQDGDPLIKSLRQAEHEELLMQNIEPRMKRAKIVIVG